MAYCLVTGTAGLPNNSVLSNGIFSAVRVPTAAVGYSSRVVLPTVPDFLSDADGAVSVSLVPGTYSVLEKTTRTKFTMTVPDQDTAQFVDCVEAASVTIFPSMIQSAIDARDAAQSYADSAATSAASAQATLNSMPSGILQQEFETVADLVANSAALDSAVTTYGALLVSVMGGLSVNDGGAATLLLVPRTGTETTYSQNGRTLSAGYEIIISASTKAIWPDKIVNAITVGARTTAFATQDESVTANDVLMGGVDDVISDGTTLWFPPGEYWHKQSYVYMIGKNSCTIKGSGIGVTVFNQADWLDGSGNPKYDNGAGGPNPSIQSEPAFRSYNGNNNAFIGIEYNARWMRERGFWIRDRYSKIIECQVSETNGRAFAASNVTGANPDTLDPAFGDMLIRDCVAIRSLGTAFSQFGNTRGIIENCRIDTCWAEGITQDASDYNKVVNNHISNVCRTDDAAGYPIAGLYDTVAGNGGIGAIGSASCSYIEIIGNTVDGVMQNDASNTSTDRPCVRWRPNKVNQVGCIIANNHFSNSPNGVHIECLYNDTDTGYIGRHDSSNATITGNTFYNIHTSTGQGTIRIDANCESVVVSGNTADTYIKIFGAYNIISTNTSGTIVDNTTKIDPSCSLQFSSYGGVNYTVNTVANMTAILKSRLFDGATCEVLSYLAGYGSGGGLFTWSASSTATADSGLVIASDEGGTGRWVRQHNGILTPWMFGGISNSGADQTTAISAMMDAVNADSTILGVDFSGIWRCNGGVISLDRDNIVLWPSNMAKLIRTSNGAMISVTGSYCRIGFHIMIDNSSGPYTGSFITENAGRNLIAFNNITGGDGQGITLADGSTRSMVIGNYVKNPGVSCYVMGKAVDPLLALNYGENSSAEAITGNTADGALVALNTVYNGGGVANIAFNDAKNCVFIGNRSVGGHHGIGTGQHGLVGTNFTTFIGNFLGNSSGYGIRMRSRYSSGVVTNITRANPGVVTFARTAITNITTANPCVVTAPGHGLIDDVKTINGVLGTTQLNGNVYRVRVIDANNFGLYEIESDTPVDSSAMTAYISGGYVDPAFEIGNGIIKFSSVAGMTEINGLETIYGKTLVNNVLTLGDANGNNFDTSGFSAYTSGGLAENAGFVYRAAAVGNITRGNALGAISWGNRPSSVGQAKNSIIANVSETDIIDTGLQKSSRIINLPVWVYAQLSANVSNQTGDGTVYNLVVDEVDDPTTSYNAGSGKFTAPYTSRYEFTFDVDISGCASATAAYSVIRANDPWGGIVSNRQDNLVPDAGSTTSSTWRGRNRVVLFLEKGAVVFPRVCVSGVVKASCTILSGAVFTCRLVG